MKKEILKTLENGIKSDVDKLIELDATDQEKAKVLKNVQIEYDIYGKQQKNELEMKLMKKRYKLEKQRQESEMENQRIKTEIERERQKSEMENQRIKTEIERERLELDKLKFNNDLINNDINNKKAKVDRIINIGLKVLEIGLPLAINTALVMLNFKLIYADDGRTPSELKDLMKNVYRAR